jgi:hypothetical protein
MLTFFCLRIYSREKKLYNINSHKIDKIIMDYIKYDDIYLLNMSSNCEGHKYVNQITHTFGSLLKTIGMFILMLLFILY